MSLLLFFACPDGKVGLNDTAGMDTSTEVSWAGEWTGTVDLFVAFNENWEEPDQVYCSGEVDLTVAERGEVDGSADCTIQWGPYMGAVAEVDFDGDATASGGVLATFTWEEEARSVLSEPLEGSVTADSMDLSSDATYSTNQGVEYEARLDLGLTR